MEADKSHKSRNKKYCSRTIQIAKKMFLRDISDDGNGGPNAVSAIKGKDERRRRSQRDWQEPLRISAYETHDDFHDAVP